MKMVTVVGLFVLGIFVMAFGGVFGGAVHSMPSIGVSAIGCIISTLGLGLCLSGLAVAKSGVTMLVAEIFSFIAILYGLFLSLANIILQSQVAPTLMYGVYMGAISITAVLVVRRAHMKSTY